MAQIETTIDSIRVTTASPERTIILKQKGTERYLPFWVSSLQADIIKSELVEPVKSTAPELFLNNINATDSKIKSVTIHLENDTFYAKLLLSHHDESYEVKCPIGIALTLGYRSDVPILVDETLFDKAGLTLPRYPMSTAPKQPWWKRLFKGQSIPTRQVP